MVLHESIVRKSLTSLACSMSQNSLLLFVKFKGFASPTHASLLSIYHGHKFFVFLQLNAYYILFFFSACLLLCGLFFKPVKEQREQRISRQIKWHSCLAWFLEHSGKIKLKSELFVVLLYLWSTQLAYYIIGVDNWNFRVCDSICLS